jgi:hypothetical protein
MTINQGRSSTAQTNQASKSNISNVVPSGTVASRVSFLEKHPLPPHILLRRSPTDYTRGHSRTGFGRRITNRFGTPAIRNGRPDKDPSYSKHSNDSAQLNTGHSYLGLNSTRTTHGHEHGRTDGGSDRRDTSGTSILQKQSTIHQRYAEKAQYDAASAKSVAPKQHKSTFWKRKEMVDPYEIDGSGNRSYFKDLTSLLPTPTSGIGHSDMHSHNGKSREDYTVKSDFSTLTTSTVRRQSVRDLFDKHGIERPDGLVPDKEMANDDTNKALKSKFRCRNCSWCNYESSSWCVKCKMVLRSVRSADSMSLISPKGKPHHARPTPDETASSSADSSEKENQPSTTSKKQDVPSRPGPRPLKVHKQILHPVVRLSSQTTTFSSFNTTQSPPKSTVMSRKTTIAEQPSAPSLFKGSRKTTLVKDSPFLIADHHISSTQSSRPFPLMMQGDSIHCPEISRRHQYPEKNPTAVDCGSPGCRATHEDHEPYRHSVSCSANKRHVPEDKDSGYVADISFAEEPGQSPSLPSSEVRSHVSNASALSLRSRKLDVSNQSTNSEYVECHGYPRTGHGRHGSASGALGQCQHCIDDCQCTSCQNTHHSVRCCMNENHQGMVHHHRHSPRTHQSHNPLECPTLTAHNPENSEVSPPASPTRTASTVIASALQPVMPFLPSETPRLNIKAELPTTIPTMGTPRSIPRFKQGTFRKESAQPPTPPTWISNPKLKTKSPSTLQPSKLQATRLTADTSLDVKAITDPPTPFKERATLSPDLSPLSQNGESTVRTWVTTLPDPVKQHDKYRCSIPSCSQCGSKNKKSRLSSVRNPWRDSKTTAAGSASTSGSVASKNFSDLLNFADKNTVPLLKNQELLEHHEELVEMERQCDEMTEALSKRSPLSNHSGQIAPSKVSEQQEKKNFSHNESSERETSTASSNEVHAAKKKGWLGLTLADKKPTPPCCTAPTPVQEHKLSEDTIVPCPDDEPAQEHFLGDGPVVDEFGYEKRMSTKRNSTIPKALVDSLVRSINKIEEHECIWKKRFVASQNGSVSQRGGDKEGVDALLKGLTVVIHWEGKEDLAIEADLRKGSVVRAKRA